MVNPNLDRLRLDNTMLLLVDVQGKLASMMHDSQAMIARLKVLIQACQILELPVVWAEQVPSKLGPTVQELADQLAGSKPLIKSSFGCGEDPQFLAAIRNCRRQQVLLCGIETHVCVWQTACRLLSEGLQVHLVIDAVSSRSEVNKQIGIQRILAAGGVPSCVEMALFELLETAEHPSFREISKLLR